MSDGAPYPIGFRCIAPEPFAPASPATVVACERVPGTDDWIVTREHDSGPRVTTFWPAVKLTPLKKEWR